MSSVVLRGNAIERVAVFLDAAGDHTDPTNLTVSIYPPGFDPREGATPGDAWVYQASLTSGGTGPQADPANLVVKDSTGKYRYTFTVPADANLGAAFDEWTGTIDLQDLDSTFDFVIVGGGSIGTSQVLQDNNVVYVFLDKSIADTSGNTLGEDYKFYFTTTYNPLYSSVRRVRLDLGPLIKDVPDDTINLALFEASLEAQALIFGVLNPDNWEYFKFARRQYVTCLAEATLLGGLAAGGGGLRSKTLGDLSVNYGSNIQSRLDDALNCAAKYEPVLNSAGTLAPGNGVGSQMVIKGATDPDRPMFGRGWDKYTSDGTPAANTKSRYTWRRRWQRDWYRRR